ncbi:aaRS-interacting multifunctional protein 2 isoform X1 [Dermacentor variabilis]|uniref:aaRS-interacting multifunctional protein 2 isoform X1 n=2 Tax=Dermacentor variabilis TaxID=34621 RepID=UPI003F5CB22C
MASVPVGCMYRVTPIYEEINAVELPNCMYRVANVYGETCAANVPNGGMPIDNAGDMVAELEHRQQQLLERLNHLRELVESVKGKPPSKQANPGEAVSSETVPARVVMPVGKRSNSLVDIVVSASPDHPPWSLWPLRRLLSQHMRVLFACHTHSSVGTLPAHLSFLAASADGGPWVESRMSHDLALTLVWKQVDQNCEVMVSPVLQAAIVGEVNLIRYLGRLLNPSYESGDAATATEVDHWLSLAHHGIIHGKNKEQQAVLKALNAQLGRTPYVLGSVPGLADIALWSALLQANLACGAPSNVKKWLKALSTNPIFSLPKGCCVLSDL